MSEARDVLSEEVDQLRRLRDELRVHAHLAQADVRDLFESMEKRWLRLEGRLGVLRDATRESAVEIREAAKLLVDEIREGYQRVKQLL